MLDIAGARVLRFQRLVANSVYLLWRVSLWLPSRDRDGGVTQRRRVSPAKQEEGAKKKVAKKKVAKKKSDVAPKTARRGGFVNSAGPKPKIH